jgi:hypothetical protein
MLRDPHDFCDGWRKEEVEEGRACFSLVHFLLLGK